MLKNRSLGFSFRYRLLNAEKQGFLGLFFRHPWEMLLDGDFSKIDIIIGTNQDEGTLQNKLFSSTSLK